jgi:hypothetical protein
MKFKILCTLRAIFLLPHFTYRPATSSMKIILRTYESKMELKQVMYYTYNVTLRCVRETIVAVEKL